MLCSEQALDVVSKAGRSEVESSRVKIREKTGWIFPQMPIDCLTLARGKSVCDLTPDNSATAY